MSVLSEDDRKLVDKLRDISADDCHIFRCYSDEVMELAKQSVALISRLVADVERLSRENFGLATSNENWERNYAESRERGKEFVVQIEALTGKAKWGKAP